MRAALTALVILAIAMSMIAAFGCVNIKRTADSAPAEPPQTEVEPTPPAETDEEPREQPGTERIRKVRPASDDDGADGRTSDLEVDQSELGLYDEPGGDLPEYVPANADEGINHVVKYADVDGDGNRDVLAITEPPKKAGGDASRTAEVTLLTWFEAESKWWAWDSLKPGREETMFDEDSIGFAYDINLDGTVEVGLFFYEETGYSDEPRQNLYLYQAQVDGLYPVTSRVLQAMSGGAITSMPGDSFILADVEDAYPGEEVVLSQARTADDDAPPYEYDMFVYCWETDFEYFSLAHSYRSHEEFEDADAAFIAFEKGEGNFEPLTFEGTSD